MLVIALILNVEDNRIVSLSPYWTAIMGVKTRKGKKRGLNSEEKSRFIIL